MPPAPAPPPWLTTARPAWYQKVHRWLTGIADSTNLGALVTIATLKERPWSVVLRVSFEKTTAYFKASGPGGAHEAALLLHLQRASSHAIPDLLAVDADRGWILMADAGTPLRDAVDPPGQLAVLRRVLPTYAELQAATMSSIEPLLDLGLPDRRLDRLPALLEELLANEVLGVGRSAEALAELRAAARSLLPELERCCADLSRSPYSAALDHGDLHPGNVLVHGDDCRFCDWGDSCVTHPFVSLGVTLEVALSQIPATAREEWARQLRDAYLEPWGAYGSLESLRADFERALWVADVVRALDFARMLGGGDEESRARWEPMVAQPLERWVRRP
jgi:tRNA A-37 threonylcarbamoyl transferase component Bud32